MEERLIALETDVAFLEEAQVKLRETVAEQQLQLHRLEAMVARIDEQLRLGQADEMVPAGKEPPPPHY